MSSLLSPGLLALDKQVRAAYSYPSPNRVLKALDQAMGWLQRQDVYCLWGKQRGWWRRGGQGMQWTGAREIRADGAVAHLQSARDGHVELPG